MKTLLQDWNLMRMLRLGLGLAITIQGIVSRDAVSIVLGIAFGAMALANIGCCGTRGCSINSRPKENSKEQV